METSSEFLPLWLASRIAQRMYTDSIAKPTRVARNVASSRMPDQLTACRVRYSFAISRYDTPVCGTDLVIQCLILNLKVYEYWNTIFPGSKRYISQSGMGRAPSSG